MSPSANAYRTAYDVGARLAHSQTSRPETSRIEALAASRVRELVNRLGDEHAEVIRRGVSDGTLGNPPAM